MGSHYHIRVLRVDGIRHKLGLFKLVIGLVYKRQTCVAVSIGITVTGEMLARGDDAAVFEPCYISCAEPCDYIGIRRKRTYIDNGI